MKTSVRWYRDRPPTPELQLLLDDAAAPGYDTELVGLPAAVLAFASTPYVPGRAVSWSLARFVATPVAALVAVSSLGGGVALAAATGSLPDAVQGIAAKLGAPAPDRPAPERETTPTQTGGGRCTAVTVGGKERGSGKALKSAPLSAAAATGCPDRPAPGSGRSATAQDQLADKPAKAVKPAKAQKPAKPAKPVKAAKTVKPVKPGTATRGGGRVAADRADPPARQDRTTPSAQPRRTGPPVTAAEPVAPTRPAGPGQGDRPVQDDDAGGDDGADDVDEPVTPKGADTLKAKIKAKTS